MGDPHAYLTTDDAARRAGKSAAQLRRDAAAGRIPGAIRLDGDRGPWRIPATFLDAERPAPLEGDGPSRLRYPATADRAVSDVTSSWRAPATGHALILKAATIAGTLSAVRSRPATALTTAAWAMAAVGNRHQADRDARCTACGWTFPCPDAQAAARTLEAIADTLGVVS